MSKIKIPEELKDKELFAFLKDNKDELIAQKKMIIKLCDAVSFFTQYYVSKSGVLTKSAASELPADTKSVFVKVAANTSMYMDSQSDVLLRDSGKKSIKERKGMIPHLHDHIHMVEAEVGDVKDIYYEDVSLKELGYNKSGSAQVLVFETDIIKSYNEKVFNKYKAGKVKQHSIGLQYVKLELAINDEESIKEFDFWNKYISDIINKEDAEKQGYFWVVPEYKLLENSAVLFGANPLTPTLEVKDTEDRPSNDTGKQPFDLSKAIRETKFLKHF